MTNSVKIFIFILLAIIYSLPGLGQWTYQISAGRSLGSDGVDESLHFRDTMQLSYRKKKLGYYSFGFSAFYRFNDKWTFRTGLDGTKTNIDIRVADDDAPGIQYYFHRRTIGDLHVPVAMQYEVFPWMHVHSGFSLRYSFFVREELEYLVGFDRQGPIEIEPYHDTVHNSIVPFTFGYRYGLTIRPIKWLNIELIRDVSFTNKVASPLDLEKREGTAKVTYGLWMLRLGYYFEWSKLKATLNK